MATTLLIGLTVALLTGLVLVAALRHARAWSEVAIGRGDRPDELFRTLGLLKRSGVRCRLRQSGGTSAPTMMGGTCTNLSLLVHAPDLVRARSLVRGEGLEPALNPVVATRRRRG